VTSKTEYVVTGLVEWRNATDANAFSRRLQRNIRRATGLNALAAAKKMRQVIQSGNFKSNAPLTVALKGSSKPLVAGGDLFQSITVQQINEDEQFVGVLRTEGDFNLVAVLHEGATIPVTPAMRWMFLLLSKASNGTMDPSKLEGRASELFSQFQGWKPLAASTTSIVIPERPFVRITFESADLIATCKANWAAACQAALDPKKKAAPEGKLAKATKKKLKRAKKLGAKYGKKAIKSAKRYGKNGKRIGKRLRKRASKLGKKLRKRASKALRGSSKGKKK
jgi:hypothetical protein